MDKAKLPLNRQSKSSLENNMESKQNSNFVLHIFSLVGAVYPWLLPWLSDLGGDFPEMGPDAGNNTFFAHKCPEYPHCSDAGMGLTVSDYIGTPPATGLFISTTVFMLMFLWQINDSVTRVGSWKPWQLGVNRGSLILFTLGIISFGMCTASYWLSGHSAAMALCFTAGLVHYISLSKHTLEKRMVRSTIMIIGTALSMGAVCCLNFVFPIFYGEVQSQEILGPWFFYYVESVGLSFIMGFPFVFECESKMVAPPDAGTLIAVPEDEATRQANRQSKAILMWFIYFFTISAAVYVWLLPWVATLCHCPGRESCPLADGRRCWAHPSDNFNHRSLAGYIATPPATGLFVGFFSWVFVQLWELENTVPSHGHWERWQIGVYRGSLLTYTVSFCVYGSLSFNYFPISHMAFMLLAFVSGTVHYISLLKHSVQTGMLLTTVTLALGGCAIGLCIPLKFMDNAEMLGEGWFFTMQCIGISAAACFPIVWSVDSGKVLEYIPMDESGS